jgi:divalent metal cation (Fe/Co/Zn/Cd) transporter
LIDAYHNPELVEEIRKIVEAEQGVKAWDILLRAAGPYVQSEIHIEVDESITVGELDKIKSDIENAVRQEFSGVQRIIILSRARKG